MPLPSPTVDYAAMETAIEDKISSGSLSLSTINAVLVSVGGETKVANDLTQSVLSLSHLSTSYDVAAIARHD